MSRISKDGATLYPDWPNGPSSGWTREQTESAMTCGVCITCGTPRETKEMLLSKAPVWTEAAELDYREAARSATELVCPHGHPQD